MSAIHDLIGQIGDSRSRQRLAAEWKAVMTGETFGSEFGDHLWELLPLRRAKPRKVDLVCQSPGVSTDGRRVRTM